MTRSSERRPLPSSASTRFLSKRRSPKHELEEIPRQIPDVPLLVNVFKGGKTPMLPVERLQQMGFRIAIYPSETQRAAIYAMRMALGLLKKDGTTEAMDAALTTFKERDKIVALDEWQKLERQFMANLDRRSNRSITLFRSSRSNRPVGSNGKVP